MKVLSVVLCSNRSSYTPHVQEKEGKEVAKNISPTFVDDSPVHAFKSCVRLPYGWYFNGFPAFSFIFVPATYFFKRRNSEIMLIRILRSSNK